MEKSATKTNGNSEFSKFRLNPINIICPNQNCKGTNYLSYNIHVDINDRWISVKLQCLDCKTYFQVNYRAVGLDILNV